MMYGKHTQPLDVSKTVRTDRVRTLTSARAGQVVPIAYVPLLRQDRVQRGFVAASIEMNETPRAIMNAITVRATAYLVPHLAMPQFEGSLDQFNRSFKKQPQVEGGSVVDFFPTIPFDPDAAFNKALGLHAPVGADVNSFILSAYNIMVNHVRSMRSVNLPQRDVTDATLATSLWQNGAFRDVVNDWEDAKISGEVDLTFSGAEVHVKGIGPNTPGTIERNLYESGETTVTPVGDTTQALLARKDPNNPNHPLITVNLDGQTLSLDLANIDRAKKTAAFAELRKSYSHLDDEHIIEMLMDGIDVPDESWKQPVMLDSQVGIIGYQERYATDGDNLAQSVTRGLLNISVSFRTPKVNTGGVVMVCLEIVPEQLFERQRDHYLEMTDPDDLPAFMRDHADPQKVRIVRNADVDVEHSVPDGIFGYAGLNTEWNRDLPNIGGKFFRVSGDPFSEDRQRIWDNDQLDPALIDDFYLAENINHDVFADTLSDPFEILATGAVQIIGNTVFGDQLDEDTGDYEAISDQIDTVRIDPDTAV